MNPIILANKKGIAFSIDFAIASIAVLLIITLFLFSLNLLIESSETELSEFSTKKEAIFLLDSMVKNHCENSFKCLAGFDASKKRAVENTLSARKLAGFSKDKNFPKIKAVWIKFKNGEKQFLLKQQTSEKNCYAFNRLVLVNGRKALLELLACGE